MRKYIVLGYVEKPILCGEIIYSGKVKEILSWNYLCSIKAEMCNSQLNVWISDTKQRRFTSRGKWHSSCNHGYRPHHSGMTF